MRFKVVILRFVILWIAPDWIGPEGSVFLKLDVRFHLVLKMRLSRGFWMFRGKETFAEIVEKLAANAKKLCCRVHVSRKLWDSLVDTGFAAVPVRRCDDAVEAEWQD
jgi:hypothetical protein